MSDKLNRSVQKPGGQEKVGPASSAAMATGYPRGGHWYPSERAGGALSETALWEVGGGSACDFALIPPTLPFAPTWECPDPRATTAYSRASSMTYPLFPQCP